VKQVASMLGTSVRTIERRLQEFSLQIRAQYSSVSDTDLHAFVLPLLMHNPQLGKSRDCITLTVDIDKHRESYYCLVSDLNEMHASHINLDPYPLIQVDFTPHFTYKHTFCI